MGCENDQSLLDRVTAALAPVGGVRAVVLGGSRGRGLQNEKSDYDIGLYYRDGLDFAALDRAAAELNDGGGSEGLMTRLGGWGAWVDGGGWLTIGGVAVDIIYRDIDRVERVTGEVERGEFTCAYHFGHPHGFISHMYAGEIATCRVLHDPDGAVAAAKARLATYPPALRAAIVTRFGHEAHFFLAIAKKGADRGDVAYVAGCAYRALACLLQMVFATNRQWLLNEKGALRLADGFASKPEDLKARVEAAFALTADPAQLKASLADLSALIDETAALA
jgi:hypothetical protein